VSKYELTPDEDSHCLALLKLKCDNLKKRNRKIGCQARWFGLLTIILLLCFCIFGRSAPRYATASVTLAALIISFKGIKPLFDEYNRSYYIIPSKRTKVNQAISNTNEIDYVGLFAEALVLPLGIEGFALIDALTRLLPKLTSDDALLLDAQQRKNLCNALQHGMKTANYQDDTKFTGSNFAEFCIAIMQAFSVIGNKEAIKPLEKLAAMNPESEQQTRVRDAARHYLPLIQQRAWEENDSAILLRASDAGTPENQLLRPAACAANETDAQHLLRAATSEEP
jgi:hypothetical protein